MICETILIFILFNQPAGTVEPGRLECCESLYSMECRTVPDGVHPIIIEETGETVWVVE